MKHARLSLALTWIVTIGLALSILAMMALIAVVLRQDAYFVAAALLGIQFALGWTFGEAIAILKADIATLRMWRRLAE